MADVFDDLIAANNLEFVTGFDNGGFIFDPDLPPFINNLQTIDDGFGYWVKVTNATVLNTSGICIADDFRKPLDAGWNLIAYPPIAPQSPNVYFADLIANNNLENVTGFEDGVLTFNPAIPDFLNTLQLMSNGFGYWVKVTNSAAKTNADLTNVFSFFYGTSNLPASEKISVLNEAEETIAIINAIEAGCLMTTPIYGDDKTTITKEYVNIGEKLRFSWNGQIADFISTFKGDYGIEQIHLEFRLESELTSTVNVFPNPLSERASIIYNSTKSDIVTIALFDASGKQIITLLENQTLQTGVNTIELNAKDLVTGIYFLKVQGREDNAIRKLMITK